MARPAFAINLPLLLSVAGVVGWFVAPGHPLIAVPLLFCPGWGLLRMVSVIDRRFAVLGCSLCLSVLALAWVPVGEAAFLTGNDLMEECDGTKSGEPNANVNQYGRCLGYLQGVSDAEGTFVSWGQKQRATCRRRCTRSSGWPRTSWAMSRAPAWR